MLTVILCVIAANAVFIGQAFHMDDGIYLLLARNIATSPWFPQDFSTYFEGLYGPDMASTEHPVPVTSYYMALIARFARGLRELNLHLAFLVFPLMLACGMFALARRYTAHPLLASLTLMFLPAVYVLLHTLMTDVPQLALWVTSAAIFIHGIESRNTIWILAGAFAAALACFVSYASLCLIPLLAVLAASRKDYRALLAILILPSVVLGAWLAVSFSHYGRLPPAHLLGVYFAIKRVLSPVLLLQKVIYIVLAIGGVMVFPLGLLMSSRRSLIAVALLLTAPAMWVSGALQYALAEQLMFIFFFCAGIGAIGEIISDFISGRETEVFLGTWFIGMLLFTAIFYITGSARYLFAAMPPFVLLFYRKIERLWEGKKLIWIGGVNLALGATLAIMLAGADYQFAGIYREFASTFHETYPAGQHRTWFAGEWGFRAYLEGSGAQELGRRDARPRKGDLLAIPTLATPYQTLFDDRLPLDSIVLVAPSRLRFAIPKISGNSVLVFAVGMPFPEKSDGLNLTISFDAPDRQQEIYSERIAPARGAIWTTRRLLLSDISKGGSIVFSSEVGGANAIADWVSIARARIVTQTENGEVVLYDFREHLADAGIECVPGMQYYTPGNLPIFPMRVWLRQDPATILRGVYNYRIPSRIRLLDAGVHAGFWSMGWGVLPFSLAAKDSTLETIRVYEISRDIDSYGETTPDWYGNP
jgi:hypothetical protein